MEAAGINNDRLESAFRNVPRELFLRPGPWLIYDGESYTATPTADPRHVYFDIRIAIDAKRRINNGEPSFHAALMGALEPSLGDHIVHIGAGTGYYTAILAEAVGPSGSVTAIECEEDLAIDATRNLGAYRNVRVISGNGGAVHFGECNGIYVNAGVTGPEAVWLDRLALKGRMILPLTTNDNFNKAKSEGLERRGGVLKLQKHSAAAFAAQFISTTVIYPCSDLRSSSIESLLSNALRTRDIARVRSLRRDPHPEEVDCWLHADAWCLSCRSIAHFTQ
jgi:protein-L-isoaspartate(D-aspartate) O-methyltransferase